MINLLLSCTLSLGACQTTRKDRIMIGTILGMGIGAGVSASSDVRFGAGIAIGGATGATLGFLSEDLF